MVDSFTFDSGGQKVVPFYAQLTEALTFLQARISLARAVYSKVSTVSDVTALSLCMPTKE